MEWWRVRTKDKEHEKRKYSRIFKDYLRDGAPNKFEEIIVKGNFHPFINIEEGKNYEPIQTIGNFTTKIELSSITKASGNTYNFRIWETAYNRAGNVMARYPLILTFTIEQRKPSSEEEVNRNPFGVVITDITGAIEKDKLQDKGGN